uniref:Uncharacterized protein n=1 Tax=Anopheles minimus TaxID=112268 RepID=A0A182VZN1_9DIPT
MNSLPVSNDDRHLRNQLWFERMQQQNRQRVVPDELNSDAPRIIQRSSTPCPFERPRRGQGRGRSHQEHPGTGISQPIGDCIETDGDVDDTLSEFAGGRYSPRRHRSRTSTMRPSTWKKLHQWLDTHQHVRDEGTEKGQSMTELRFDDYVSSEEENNDQSTAGDASERELFKNGKQEPDETNKEPTNAQPERVPEVVERPPSKDKSIGAGYRFLKNVMMFLLYIIETILPVTYPLLTFLRHHTKSALLYLWVRFFQPIMMQGTQTRENPLSMVIMILMLPLFALLGIVYCLVSILYWLHRLFLIEP